MPSSINSMASGPPADIEVAISSAAIGIPIIHPSAPRPPDVRISSLAFLSGRSALRRAIAAAAPQRYLGRRLQGYGDVPPLPVARAIGRRIPDHVTAPQIFDHPLELTAKLGDVLRQQRASS